MKPASSGARWAIRGAALGAAVLVGLLGAGPAAADPGKADPVASLINQIADVDQSLSDLASNVQIKQENVNRTLVDFQNALAAQQVAAAASSSAKKSLHSVSARVEAAQKEFDAFVRSVNRQGNNRGAMTKYVASDDPSKVLDQMTAVDQITRDQQATIRKLQVARNQQANRVAATEATRLQTTMAADDAAARKRAAVSAVKEAETALSTQRGKREKLVSERDSLTQRLKAMRQTTSGDSGSRTPADAIDKALKKIPSKPVAGDDAVAQAAEAATKLAVETGQALLASLIGKQDLPKSEFLNELGIGGSSEEPGGDVISRLGSNLLGGLLGGGGGGEIRPGLRGPQAIDLVIDRMKSQLGVTYAWGGGDANGPTLGIRDGGVADSYGDYQKVGFDCSGLMIYGFAAVGIDLPHYTGYQYTSGPQVPLSEMKRGDMIFYGPNASQHVALILGDGTMIEAPASGDVVKISPVRTDGAMPNVVRLL
ncbi:NlpC/P60 family protein [Gordonia shandongensis]|uniref:NlpC/P60 family protein n=1 Tax=Gordonia shandongensis TaxID=376351 RepID=UPI0003FD4C29|nr:NlpC/P60 family protein [Gordonia shandongensis]